MHRYASFVALFGLLTLVGCGSGGPSSDSPATASVQPQPTVSQQTTHRPTPADVVSQFLDEVRRGGEDSRANDLLTQKAQAELRRIGHSIQPIGSPDARFQVTRAESVPGEEASALVHSVWSEPNGDGSTSDFQVVWAVEQEPVGWRISGLAMELDPKQEPVIMDFENAEAMSALLDSPAESASAATPENGQTQANAPASTISR